MTGSLADAAPDILLNEMNIGVTVQVTGVLGGRKTARELGDLGIRTGHRLNILRRVPGGGLAVRYSAMTVAIGSALARQILVRPVCPL